MPNVFPDDVLARIRALKTELDALTLVVDTGGGGSSSPLTTKGDVWGYDSADNRVPVGADGEVLTADSGDALGVSWQAGGGGASPLTTKGDLFTYSTVDDRLGVGANATILQADSAQTTGNRWAALSGDATVATGGALTFATVNSNVGSFGDTTHIPSVTVNAKGLVTAASNNVVAFTPVMFSYPGSVFVNTESPRWYPPASFTLTAARLSLLATSASNLVVKVRVNGSDVDTLTLTAGNVTTTASISDAVTTSDYITVKVTSVGVDAANASVELNL